MKLHVIGRAERGSLPPPSRPIPTDEPSKSRGIVYPEPRPILALTLQSRERAGLDPLVIVVDPKTYESCPVGTEVEVTVRAVIS